MNQKIECYILGTAYTGSTILGEALNMHSKIAYVGELSRAQGYYDLHRFYNSPDGCMYCHIDGKSCSIFTDNFLKGTNNYSPAESYLRLRKAYNKPVLIDGSKHARWLEHVLKQREDISGIRAIILAKNPTSYLSSCSDRGIGNMQHEATVWRDTYFNIFSLVNLYGLPTLVIRHEDFVANPEKILRKITNFLNLKYEKRMVNSKKQPLHAIGGNPGAYIGTFDIDRISIRNKKLGQKYFDVNPIRLTSKIINTSKAKIMHAKYVKIILETPSLIDLYRQLGFNIKDL